LQPEVDAVSERLRHSVLSCVPSLSTAAGYFFRPGVMGKRLRPTLVLLMASALTDAPPPPPGSAAETEEGWRGVDLRPAAEHAPEMRRRQQRVAEVGGWMGRV
jgi:geranyl diphosphate synthase